MNETESEIAERSPREWLILPYPPSVNHMYATYNGRRIISREGRAYKTSAGLRAYTARIPRLIGEISVTLIAYRPRKSGDLDNILKATFDSLKGIAWEDDKQITRISAERRDDKSNPRIELKIEAIDPMRGGISIARDGRVK